MLYDGMFIQIFFFYDNKDKSCRYPDIRVLSVDYWLSTTNLVTVTSIYIYYWKVGGKKWKATKTFGIWLCQVVYAYTYMLPSKIGTVIIRSNCIDISYTSVAVKGYLKSRFKKNYKIYIFFSIFFPFYGQSESYYTCKREGSERLERKCEW